MTEKLRAFKRGDQVTKKLDRTQLGRVEGSTTSSGTVRGTVLVYWKTGLWAGQVKPYPENELVLLSPAPALWDQLRWLGQVLIAFRRQIDLHRPFTEAELDAAEVAFYEGQTPEQFIETLTTELHHASR